MKLRQKLLLAQLPAIVALFVAAAIGASTALRLGEQPGAILHENFRTIDAAAAILGVIEHPSRIASDAEAVDAALRLQRSNVTEVGEAALTDRIVQRWEALREGRMEERAALVDDVRELQAMNHAAMLRKSAATAEDSRAAVQTLWIVVALAALIGVAATLLRVRALTRPLGLLELAVARIAEGDFENRVRVPGRDELASLGAALNAMAERIDGYQKSSLGKVLAEREQMRAVLDSLLDPVIVYDLHGRVTASNARGSTLAALDAVQRTVAPVRDRVLSGFGAERYQKLDEAVPIQVGDEERWWLIGVSPIYAQDGRVRGATVALQEVTSLHRIDSFKRDLVAGVAHEFRTPLTSLHMAVHMCLEGVAGPLTPKQDELLHAARADGERLEALVGELLELARLEAGGPTVVTAPARAEALCAAAVKALAPQAEARGVTITLAGSDPMLEVEVDRERIRHVFDNLLANALRHVAQGGRVALGWRAEGAMVRFEVADDGPGIPQEHRPHVFDRFYRVPGQEKVGTGLGLSIVRETVEAHGGDVGVEASDIGGALFWFTLPAVA